MLILIRSRETTNEAMNTSNEGVEIKYPGHMLDKTFTPVLEHSIASEVYD